MSRLNKTTTRLAYPCWGGGGRDLGLPCVVGLVSFGSEISLYLVFFLSPSSCLTTVMSTLGRRRHNGRNGSGHGGTATYMEVRWGLLGGDNRRGGFPATSSLSGVQINIYTIWGLGTYVREHGWAWTYHPRSAGYRQI